MITILFRPIGLAIGGGGLEIMASLLIVSGAAYNYFPILLSLERVHLVTERR